MEKQKLYMTVMNTLRTDARVQRAAKALEDEYNVIVIGIGDNCGEQKFNQIILDIKARNNIFRYFEYISKCKTILRKESFVALYAHDYFSAALIPWVKHIWPNVKLIYDAHELIIPEEGGKLSTRDLFFYYLEKRAVQYADLIICANSERANIMWKHYMLDSIPTVVANISELPIIEDEYSKELLIRTRKVFDSKELVLVYAGVLDARRRIEELISIIKESSKGKLLIIGDGPDKSRLEKIARENISGRYFFTGSIPYQYMGILLRMCDIGYISYPTNNQNNKYCAPNKIYEYASVELPMIAPYNPTIYRFFSEYGIGEIRDNLKDSFDIVAANLQKYKKNCKKFSMLHPWSKEAISLVNKVNELITEEE